jgi:hypothetical protein
MKRKRHEWRFRRRPNVWEHIPTGVCFAGDQIEKHGWHKAVFIVTLTQEWRAFLDEMPTTTLQKERDQLLVLALNERNEQRLRQLTLRWTLWHQEATDTRGGQAGG